MLEPVYDVVVEYRQVCEQDGQCGEDCEQDGQYEQVCEQDGQCGEVFELQEEHG